MNTRGFMTLLPLLTLLHLPSPLAGESASATTDALWRRAVELVGANDGWTAGTVEMTGEERDGRGRTRSTWLVRTRTTRGVDGQPVQEILEYRENGKDVTAEKRAARAGGSGGGGGGRNAFNWNPAEGRQTPFHPLNQATVEIRRLAGSELVDGTVCAVYEFTQGLGGRDRAVGTAWLDMATGAPLRLRGTVEPLPVFVHGGNVDVRYAQGRDGAWTVREFHLLGEVTLVLIRRSFVMDIAMSDHWRP